MKNDTEKDQRNAVSLLYIGSVFEYFDLNLYMHMATLLNGMFFPISGAFSSAQIAVFTIWAGYAFRPFGALFFGAVGDTLGRKVAVILSAMTMGGCCLTIAALPTYQRIGIAAPIILTLCRMIQGISASAEVTGAQIYIAESVKPPTQYPLVSYINVFTSFGSTLAIGVAAFFTNTKLFPDYLEHHSWRFAFLVGAFIGVVGGVARSQLKETTEFSNKKQEPIRSRFQLIQEEKEKLPLISISYFVVCCSTAPVWYLIYIYCPSILKERFGYTHNQAIALNFWISIFDVIVTLLWGILSYYFYPMKLLRVKALGFLASACIFPLLVTDIQCTPLTIVIFQCLFAIFWLGYHPASAIFVTKFPINKRFRYAGVILALAKSASYLFGPMSVLYASLYLGPKGITLIFVPLSIIFGIAVHILGNSSKKGATE